MSTRWARGRLSHVLLVTMIYSVLLGRIFVRDAGLLKEYGM